MSKRERDRKEDEGDDVEKRVKMSCVSSSLEISETLKEVREKLKSEYEKKRIGVEFEENRETIRNDITKLLPFHSMH